MAPIKRHKLDLRGAIIPFALLKVCQVLKTMPPGDILEVFWGDPDAPNDLFKILPQSSYKLLMMEEMQGKESSYRMEIKKKTLATD